jgi:hypothetical protein
MEIWWKRLQNGNSKVLRGLSAVGYDDGPEHIEETNSG